MSAYRTDQANLAWQVSRTCDGGQCIGVARRGDAVLIGNTSNPQAPVSEFTVSEWQQFLTGVKLGDFDKIALRSSPARCVEIGTLDESVLVRSSVDPDGECVTLSRGEWQVFVAGVKDGDFDDL